MKNFIAATPLKVALKAFISALKDSANAFVALLTKQLSIPIVMFV